MKKQCNHDSSKRSIEVCFEHYTMTNGTLLSIKIILPCKMITSNQLWSHWKNTNWIIWRIRRRHHSFQQNWTSSNVTENDIYERCRHDYVQTKLVIFCLTEGRKRSICFCNARSGVGMEEEVRLNNSTENKREKLWRSHCITWYDMGRWWRHYLYIYTSDNCCSYFILMIPINILLKQSQVTWLLYI